MNSMESELILKAKMDTDHAKTQEVSNHTHVQQDVIQNGHEFCEQDTNTEQLNHKTDLPEITSESQSVNDNFLVEKVVTRHSEPRSLEIEIISNEKDADNTEIDQMLAGDCNSGSRELENIANQSEKVYDVEGNKKQNVEQIKSGQSEHGVEEIGAISKIDHIEKMEMDQVNENQASESNMGTHKGDAVLKMNKIEQELSAEVMNENVLCEPDSASVLTITDGKEQLNTNTKELQQDTTTFELHKGRHVQELRKSLSTIVEKFMSHIK